MFVVRNESVLTTSVLKPSLGAVLVECGGKAVPNSHIDIDMSIFGSKIRTVFKNLRC